MTILPTWGYWQVTLTTGDFWSLHTTRSCSSVRTSWICADPKTWLMKWTPKTLALFGLQHFLTSEHAWPQNMAPSSPNKPDKTHTDKTRYSNNTTMLYRSDVIGSYCRVRITAHSHHIIAAITVLHLMWSFVVAILISVCLCAHHHTFRCARTVQHWFLSHSRFPNSYCHKH
jgi:hypothetical protein